MKPIINHTYKVKYKKPTRIFEFVQKNSIVSFVDYKDKITPFIEDVAYELYQKTTSRQAYIPVSEGVTGDCNTCLQGYQYQFQGETLYVTVNQRSQCAIWGRPHDEELVRYITYMLLNTQIFRALINAVKVDITFNVGNYHERTDIKE